MVRTVKVGAMISSDASETTGNQHLAEKGETKEKQTPRLLKLLTGFCIGQVIVVAISVATLGVIVSSNTKEVGELKLKTETLQTDVEKFLSKTRQETSDNSVYINDIGSRLLKIESEHEFQELSARIDILESDKDAFITTISQLQSDSTADRSSIQSQMTRITQTEANLTSYGAIIKTQGEIIQDFNNTIMQHEADKNEQNSSMLDVSVRLAKLETGLQFQVSRISDIEESFITENATIEDHSSKIAKLESTQQSDQYLIFNNTVRLIGLEAKFKEQNTSLEIETRKLLILESKVETNRVDIEEHIDRIRRLEENVTDENAITLHQSSRISQLEMKMVSVEDGIEVQNGTIDQLKMNIQTHNTSLYDCISKLEELESKEKWNQDFIANQSIRIQDLELSEQSQRSAIQAQNTRLLELELEVNFTQLTLQDYNITLLELEDEANSTQYVLQAYNIQLSELELVANATQHTLQDHSTRLLETELETNITQNALKDNSNRLTGLTDALNCTWEDWTVYSACSHSCGGGTKYRTRSCQSEHLLSQDWFSRTETDIQPCNAQTCPDYKSGFTVSDPADGPTSGTIKFKTLITRIGWHYDFSTGKFTCEYPGIYIFSVHILKSSGKDAAYCRIRQNGTYKVRVYTDPTSTCDAGYYGSSNTILLHLSQGDVIDLGGCTPAADIFSYNSVSTFSGFLLKAD